MRLRRAQATPRVEMVPLMDVVFLLLVFFVYAMMTMAVHRGTGVTLPSSTTAKMELQTRLALTVRTDGTLFLDKEEVLPDILASRLRAMVEAAGESEEPSIQVFAEDTLTYQMLYQVLDIIKGAGVKAVSLQARKDEGP